MIKVAALLIPLECDAKSYMYGYIYGYMYMYSGDKLEAGVAQ